MMVSSSSQHRRSSTVVRSHMIAQVCYKVSMPKLVDPDQRRSELAQAVWTVIRRDGLQRASVRNVAREAGLSMGSLRHYFASQSELLCFAMELVGDRARDRVGALEPAADTRGPMELVAARPRARGAALEPAADPRRRAEQLLAELVPLDDERRAESEVWLAFTGQPLVGPAAGAH